MAKILFVVFIVLFVYFINQNPYRI
ncbi:hypothetical protein LJC58_01230 [Lachnospiraceae bacterium OttesenSCG-928-D06]|nr:hypothetical protein [Lachnospiraceae bacterium OttesenSCG-928-D06]